MCTLRLGVFRQVAALGEILAQQPIGVLTVSYAPHLMGLATTQPELPQLEKTLAQLAEKSVR